MTPGLPWEEIGFRCPEAQSSLGLRRFGGPGSWSRQRDPEESERGSPRYAILFALMDPQPQPPGARRAHALRPEDGRLRRGRRSHQRIREAARALFREYGFDRTTLRAIGARAGMGASSIYRHVQSKEELLIQDLADLQEEAWSKFRRHDDHAAATRVRIHRFFQTQHELLAQAPDLTVIALRATTHPQARVAGRVLGTMTLVATGDTSFGQADVVLAQQLADIAAPHLELSRRAALSSVPSGSRRRIGR